MNAVTAAVRLTDVQPILRIDPTAPLDVAKAYISSRAEGEQLPDLAYWQGEFWRALGTHYEQLTLDGLKADIYGWLDTAADPSGKPLKPHKRMVEGIIDALKAAAHLSIAGAPAWIGDSGDLPAADALISCRNGLLDISTKTLTPATRRYFTLNALDFDYTPDAQAPLAWLAFLRDLWGDDTESIETLQEVFGLALTSDTSHQKAFLLVGPRRSGKGTIARVLTNLVGIGNVTAPTLSSVGQQFGLESALSKTLAIVSDARIGRKADLDQISENILRVTGEDAISVHRKFKPDWTARLRVRFVILSNELPTLLDQSGALAGRFIVLRLTRSFFGSEDRSLTPRLLAEMPGIMAWALQGLDRLRARGYFRQPATSLEMVRQLEALSSPIKGFVEDRCILAPGASIECRLLYEAWREWSQQQGREHAGSSQIFGRNLSAAFPELSRTSLRVGGGRVRHYEGIRLRDAADAEGEAEDAEHIPF